MGRRNIGSNYNSKARDTSRSCQIKNTGERDQTHSYWYIPSAPRVNYSLLVMGSTGMMKMATGDGFPLQQGAGMDSREVFGGYRGLRRRNSRSRFLSGGLGIYRRVWRREQVRRTHGVSTRHRGAPGGHPPPSWAPRDSSPITFCCSIFYIFQKKSPLIFRSKNKFREVSGPLDSI